MLKKVFIGVLVLSLLGASGCGTLQGRFVAKKDRLQISYKIATNNATYGALTGFIAGLGFSSLFIPMIAGISLFYITDEITGGMYLKKVGEYNPKGKSKQQILADLKLNYDLTLTMDELDEILNGMRRLNVNVCEAVAKYDCVNILNTWDGYPEERETKDSFKV